jgi:hypothetical protein
VRNLTLLLYLPYLVVLIPFGPGVRGAPRMSPVSETNKAVTFELRQFREHEKPSIEAASPESFLPLRPYQPLRKGSRSMSRTALQRADVPESAADLLDRIFGAGPLSSITRPSVG